jgi:OPA family glycerol-3-phosphate transporter-like MFS transporter
VPKYLQEVRGLAPDGAAYVALVLPLAGAVGAVGAGWLSDRFFAGRRGPVATALLALLAVSVWAYGRLDTDSWLLDVLVLGSIGVCTYGPDMLLAAAGTLDVGPPRGAAAAVGFVNGIGYFGAILAGAGLGVVVDWLGWGAAFHCLVGAAAAAALVASTSCWWPSPTAR